MIKAVVNIQEQEILSLSVTGHALTGEPGYDLVCAGVSSVMVGSLNALDALATGLELTMSEEPLIQIDVKSVNQTNQLLMNFVLQQLETIEFMHGNALHIKKEVTA